MKKKRLIISVIFVIVFLLVILFSIVRFYVWGYWGYHRWGYYEYGTYDDFKTYQYDFESVKEALSDTGLYYISVKNAEEDNQYRITEKTELNIIPAHTDTELPLSDTQKESLASILIHSYGYQYNYIGFTWISVTDDSVFFEYDANGSGIMYTEHIKKQIKELEEQSVYDNEKYGYSKLGKNWYGVYR